MFSRFVRPWIEDMLPENVMMEVLSKLPVKSIIRCKRVCKKWRDVVSDPYFVHLHHSRSREGALLIHEGDRPPGTLKWVEIIKHEVDYHLDPVKSLDPYSFPLGSVNGLICCWGPNRSNDHSIYIFNPVLKQKIPLPKLELAFEPSLMTYGFGVSMAGEYKVILRGRRDPNQPYVFEVQVYTIGTNQWRILQTPDHLHYMPKCAGVFLSGHVYWIGCFGSIYDFDLNTETFGLLPPLPRGGDRIESKKMLGVLKGRLSRISWCSRLGLLKLWVMKEGRWYQERSLQENIISPIFWSQVPLCLIDGLQGTGVLMVYDTETKDLTVYCLNTNTMILRLEGKRYLSTIMTYRPSFVKLDSFVSERVDHAVNDNNLT